MFTILLHTSKTMRTPSDAIQRAVREPIFASEAQDLSRYLKTLSIDQIQKIMKLSKAKAEETHTLIHSFQDKAIKLPVLDIFLGDIYSGLQVQSLSNEDRQYADENRLYILSGMYGLLKPLDYIQPYRLEMGYKLLGNNHDSSVEDIKSMYTFWGDKIARQLPKDQTIINLSAVEYTKAVFGYFKILDDFKDVKIITPKFLTISQKTGEPTFVTVHAKIARGAYARWLIQNRIEDVSKLKTFNELGYAYDEVLSTASEPVFIARTFQGLGLSVRLR